MICFTAISKDKKESTLYHGECHSPNTQRHLTHRLGMFMNRTLDIDKKESALLSRECHSPNTQSHLTHRLEMFVNRTLDKELKLSIH